MECVGHWPPFSHLSKGTSDKRKRRKWLSPQRLAEVDDRLGAFQGTFRRSSPLKTWEIPIELRHLEMWTVVVNSQIKHKDMGCWTVPHTILIKGQYIRVTSHGLRKSINWVKKPRETLFNIGVPSYPASFHIMECQMQRTNMSRLFSSNKRMPMFAQFGCYFRQLMSRGQSRRQVSILVFQKMHI